ncbi:MAG: glycosyltransferase family 4 protein [Bacteroides sp.]|nr:glycosyltransferase family 4 protein [Bacteroides sp.]
MIILLRSTDGNPDSRFEKYVTFLANCKVDYFTICWDRFGIKTSTNNTLYYKCKSAYGLHFKNLINLLGFNWFLIKKLIKYRSKYKVIHAADFDTIIPAILMKFIFRKKVIYDIYDWYIDSRRINNSILKWIIKKIEYINITYSDIVIICEEGRKEQIIYTPKKLWILPNIPYFNLPTIDNKINKRLLISYIGILGSGRGLLNLLKLAKEHPEIDFVSAGFGELENEFKAAAKLSNFNYYGRVSYSTALQIMSSSDIIYAMYERVNPNHLLAAPNKYYEGLALGKPIITTIGTLVGNKVEKFSTGYCIDEDYDSLNNLVINITSEDIAEKSKNSKELWYNTYKDYINRFFHKEYLKFIINCHE